MTLLLLTLNLLPHAAFIWGRFAVFRIGERLPPGANLIQILATMCILFDGALIARRNGDNPAMDAVAIGAAILSGALFIWAVGTIGLQRLTAAFSEDPPTELIVSGPFRFVRNPCYLAYLLIYLQAVLASRSFWAALPLVSMASIYRRAALLEEKKFLCSRLAAQYRRYIATTGRFLPKLVPRSRARLQQSIHH
jgi:protein-S-isoprenylcysteine O-methyltransferase Ste14